MVITLHCGKLVFSFMGHCRSYPDVCRLYIGSFVGHACMYVGGTWVTCRSCLHVCRWYMGHL